jgi:cation diffusion facilitator family transporter
VGEGDVNQLGGESDEAAPFRHAHEFLGRHHDRNARKTRAVLVITALMMVFEIGAGLFTQSMALLADGAHMATHAGVMLIAAGAYFMADRRKHDRRFSFGVGKFGDLAAFGSAVVLALTAAGIGFEAITRLLSPKPVAFLEALPVAVLGLAVNLLSAWLLRDEHHHHGHDHGHGDHAHHGHDHHGHGHAHAAAHHEHDLNLRAAYLHVAADAAVSVLAILALALGATLGWTWTDPVVGLVGALVIGRWAFGLIKAAGAVLVDMTPTDGLEDAVAQRLQSGGERLSDLHVWRVGPGAVSVIAAIVTDTPQPAEVYRRRLSDLTQVRHSTIEVIGL